MSSVWPEFSCAGKENTTIKHALCHQAGLQHALPPNMGMSTFTDFEACVEHLQEVIWPSVIGPSADPASLLI